MPEPLGRACIFPGDAKRSVTVVDVCIVRSGSAELDHRWLVWTLNAPQFQGAVAALQSGSTRKRISRGNLAKLALPVPPAREQRRIAEEIERHLTRIDAAVANLERVKAQLARYRASVLKAACEGRLVPTEAELARHGGRLCEPVLDALLERADDETPGSRRRGRSRQETRSGGSSEPIVRDLPALPESWRWVRLEQLVTSLRNGLSTVPSAPSGPRVLRISAVRPLRLDLGDVRFLPGPAADYEDFSVTEGDVLFTRYNGSVDLVGVAAVVSELREPTFYPDKLIRARVGGACDPRFLAIAVNTGRSRDFLASRIRTTAGQAGVSGGDLRVTPVPLPPLPEQRRIVAEVERHLSIADGLVSGVASALRRAAALRQSILKRAFEGKLVPQDPSDEPASVLLERIRKEREALGAERPAKAKRSTRRAPAAKKARRA